MPLIAAEFSPFSSQVHFISPNLSVLPFLQTTRYLFAPLLRRYFHSGWAFLIPYLAAYLLYYITGWPVNASTDASSTAHSPSPFAPPPLIHLYWLLHAFHLILATRALRSWWTESSAQYVRNASDSQSSPYSSYRLHVLTRIAPWAILALIFYIPGVYLEWPSDPWEHLRRINEWRILETVGAHSYWSKSAYFIPYSLLSWCIGLRQLFWLDFYYTGICLLLCWQYYRFSRVCGLGERASMVFVLMQALLFGNDIFSFYRYYGISSSIYAQLGAIALTRVVLEWAAFGRTNLNRETKTESSVAMIALSGYSLPATRYSMLPSIFRPFKARPSFWHLPSLARTMTAGLSLLALTAFNHPQGIGIAGLGITAIIMWRLGEWKRSALYWPIVAGVVISIIPFSLYPIPTVENYRTQGYLGAWYGFNILDPASPAGERMLQIVSAFGLISLVGAFIIRKQVVGYLTITPFLVLLLPCFSVPLSYILSKHNEEGNIITFQRMFLAIPYGLALTFSATILIKKSTRRLSAAAPLAASLVAITLLDSKQYIYNRTWHLLSTTPADLRVNNVLESIQNVSSKQPSPQLHGSLAVGALSQAVGELTPAYASRTINTPTAIILKPIIDTITNDISRINLTIIPSRLDCYSPYSYAGQMSKHWPPQEVSVDLAGEKELQELLLKFKRIAPSTNSGSIIHKTPDDKTKNSTPLQSHTFKHLGVYQIDIKAGFR